MTTVVPVALGAMVSSPVTLLITDKAAAAGPRLSRVLAGRPPPAAVGHLDQHPAGAVQLCLHGDRGRAFPGPPVHDRVGGGLVHGELGVHPVRRADPEPVQPLRQPHPQLAQRGRLARQPQEQPGNRPRPAVRGEHRHVPAGRSG
jgi:hypothetical protein